MYHETFREIAEDAFKRRNDVAHTRAVSHVIRQMFNKEPGYEAGGPNRKLGVILWCTEDTVEAFERKVPKCMAGISIVVRIKGPAVQW